MPKSLPTGRQANVKGMSNGINVKSCFSKFVIWALDLI
jgi:hypothetical protein